MEENKNEVAVQGTAPAPAIVAEMSVDQVVARVEKVKEIKKRVMHAGVHYGVIPGTERTDAAGKDISKPTLYQPGADLLCMAFMLDPQFEHEVINDGEHRDILSRCTLYHIPTGARVASGEGSCSTREAKYAWRKGDLVCPDCKKQSTLRRGKNRQTNKDEFYCWAKLGGCNAHFDGADKRVTDQRPGRVANPDLADTYNTVLKMANKRSKAAAVLIATGGSEIFTQDIGDDDDPGVADDSGAEQGNGKSAETKGATDKMPSQIARENRNGAVANGNGDASKSEVDPEAPLAQAQQDMLAKSFRNAKLTDENISRILAKYDAVDTGDLKVRHLSGVLMDVIAAGHA